jgi:uncharacterized protein YukE
MEQQIYSVILRSETVYILSVMIFLLALYSYLRLRSQLKPYIKSVEDAHSLLAPISTEEDFASGYEDLAEKVGQDRVLSHIWSEYEETLVFPNILSEQQIVMNTIPAASFFTRTSLIGDSINLRHYIGMASLLTGLGVLFTFVGLVAGVHEAGAGLAAGMQETSKTQGAIKDLLSGASLAFITSIAGLLSSILYGFFEKRQFHHLDSALLKFTDCLDSLLSRVTPEKISRDLLDESKKQTESLGAFVNDLVVQFTQAFESSLKSNVTAPLLEQIAETNKRLLEISNGREETAKDSLSELVTLLADSFKEISGNAASNTTKILTEVSEKLSSLVDALSVSATQLTTASKEQVELGNQQSANVLGSIDKMLSDFEGALRLASDQISVSTVSLKESLGGISEVTDKQGRAVKAAADLISKAESSVVKLADSSGRLELAASAATSSVASVESTTKTIQASVESMNQSMQQSKQIWDGYSSRFDQSDEKMEYVMRQMVDGLEAYQQSIKEFILDIDQNVGKITESLAAAISELDESVESLSEALARK